MDIFRSRFYSINVTLLSLVGLWPYQRNKSWQLCQQILSQIIIISATLVTVIKVFEIWGDLDILIEAMTPVGVVVISWIKFFNCVFQRKKMVQLLEIIKSDWSNLRNEKDIEILTKYADQGRNLTITYTVAMSVSGFMYLAIPLMPRILDIIVPLNESRKPIYLFQAEYFVDPDEYSEWILLHTYTSTTITVIIIMAADTIFVCCVMHACGILAVTGHRLENLTSKCPDNDDSIMLKDDDDGCYREIVLCMDQHYRATVFANIIESSYSISYLLVFGVAMVLLSMSAVQILIKLDQFEEVIRLLMFNAGQCTHLLFNSWPCQKLIDESDKYRESLYAAEWYSLSERNKHLLRFAMLRTLKSEQITAGKIYLMSMENFSKVMQTSMSYFTVFASIR